MVLRGDRMLFLLLAGCPVNDNLGPPRTQVWSMFPFDGVRTWTYESTDTETSYRLVGTSSGEPEGAGVYTVVYTTECVSEDPECVDGEVLRKVQWSSDIVDGVHIHAWDVGDGFVDLAPPVRLTTADMARDEVLETAVGAAVWTSTMLGVEHCPVVISPDWNACGAFELAVDTGDGAPIAGTYWATVGNGFAAFALTHETGQWQLSDVTCDGECDGSW